MGGGGVTHSLGVTDRNNGEGEGGTIGPNFLTTVRTPYKLNGERGRELRLVGFYFVNKCVCVCARVRVRVCMCVCECCMVLNREHSLLQLF